jgi:hypothetical protein
MCIGFTIAIRLRAIELEVWIRRLLTRQYLTALPVTPAQAQRIITPSHE